MNKERGYIKKRLRPLTPEAISHNLELILTKGPIRRIRKGKKEDNKCL